MQSNWTVKEWFGPMSYFTENCLETSSDQFYALGDESDFGKIKIEDKYINPIKTEFFQIGV